jgi:hypothetical protein
VNGSLTLPVVQPKLRVLKEDGSRFIRNRKIKVKSLYLPLVLTAISNWNSCRLYLALDTTVLWNRFCSLHLSIVCPKGRREASAVAYRFASSFRTVHGMTIQIKGLRQRVDPHCQRGLSYLKIGLRWLRGVLHKGRDLLKPMALLCEDPQPCGSIYKG